MLALIALACFVVAAVKVGSTDTYAFWLCLGLAFVAADMIFAGLGGYQRFFHRRP